jgi:putative peptide zinc metalloprotease protein
MSGPTTQEQLVLVLPGGVRHPVVDAMTIGRSDDASIRLEDRTVSRLHARIVVGTDGLVIEDAGSTFGVTVSGEPLSAPRRLAAGQEIRLGDVVLRVERAVALAPTPPALSAVPTAHPAVPAAAANQTIVVPVNATELGLRAAAPNLGDGALRPRLRSGWALKQVDSQAGVERYALRDLRTGVFLTLDRDGAVLLELFDGHRTVTELITEAMTRLGPTGPGRLASLVADLGDRGLLEGIAATPRVEPPPGLLARAFKSRDWTLGWVPGYFQSAYRHWGRVLCSALSVTVMVLLSLAGLVVFAYLVGARYGTPLVVAHKLIIGGAVFIVGRFTIVAVHELAHGLALAHYGRTTTRAGLRLTFIFPYAFVDSSEAYFETRAHRIAISAAGPLSDFSLGALFSILCAVSPRGNVRDVFFQLAFAGYVGAFFNANPFLDRDGYQILSEWLREPRLKQRARQQLRERLTGHRSAADSSPVLGRYAIAGLVWSVIGAGFVAVMSLRYYHRLSTLAPHGLVLGLFIAFFVVLLLPIPIALGVPLFQRARYGTPEVNRVVS